MKILFTVLATCIIVSRVSAATPDTIRFENGATVKGTLIETTPNHVRIKTEHGDIVKYSQMDISYIIDRLPLLESAPLPAPIPPVDMPPPQPQPPLPLPDAIIPGLLSALIPGAGQAYNGETEKTIVFLGAWAAGIYYSVTAFEPIENGSGVYVPHDKAGQLTLGALATWGSIVVAIIDAVVVRNRINKLQQRNWQFSSINESNTLGSVDIWV